MGWLAPRTRSADSTLTKRIKTSKRNLVMALFISAPCRVSQPNLPPISQHQGDGGVRATPVHLGSFVGAQLQRGAGEDAEEDQSYSIMFSRVWYFWSSLKLLASFTGSSTVILATEGAPVVYLDELVEPGANRGLDLLLSTM